MWRAVEIHEMEFAKIAIALAVTAVRQRLLQKRTKHRAKLRKIDAILGTLRARHARLHVSEIQVEIDAVIDFALPRHSEHFLGPEIIFERRALLVGPSRRAQIIQDRKSTRLNSSHVSISYAVFCLKKKK